MVEVPAPLVGLLPDSLGIAVEWRPFFPPSPGAYYTAVWTWWESGGLFFLPPLAGGS